ncbi:MAG: 16S rRNA (cytidine(1402)-2'-O)-methyltransferase [Betaproteobacteria bacterium]|nr:MAG: 16S rRNA (cytidine(1402)-2'-O)-methyltransferase [Betaproteobacteria bacterium]
MTLHTVVEEAKDSVLYVVATPIGNLRDITLRALDILKSVDVVAAEDTRVCGKLLRHFGIDARVIASHEHNERRSAAGIVKLLAEGKSVALTTDAGTPAISDPGSEVVARAREEGFAVVPIPGASALTAALSICGQRLSRVMFCGFLPAKEGDRRKVLQELAGASATLVFYEAPHRILKTLEDMAQILGADTRVALCRELTKLHEETHVCALAEARAWLESMPERVRGEFVVVVQRGETVKEVDMQEGERLLALLMPELPLKKAVTLAAEISGGRKNALYRRALELAGNGDAQ